MIYFVDEEMRKLRALVTELKFNNFDSEVIGDADSAFYKLCELPTEDVDLVIIDVMLGVKANGSNFNRDETEDFKKTGLLLLERLVKENPEVFPRKAVFLSNASSKKLVKQIEMAAKDNQIPYLSKHNFDTPYDFAEKVTEIISKINGSR